MNAATSDPRTTGPGTAERDVRPQVNRPPGGLSNGVIIALAAIGGVLLFATLDARRVERAAPAVAATVPATGSAAPPPLYLPPPREAPPLTIRRVDEPEPASAPAPQSVSQQQALPQPPDRYEPQPDFSPPLPSPAPPRSTGGSALVIDLTPGSGPADSAAGPASPPLVGSTAATDRVRAGSLENKSQTVPQGTLIPAVLETAFDSTRPGFARALVQRDIRGFDGTRVVIPRGSRLIGEYSADAAPGQKRAMILWSRLIRPDGVTISIGSPAADPVGRGGVSAKVNSHFFDRFAGAILQSTLDVGVNLASRGSDSPVIVAVPGSVQNVTSPISRQRDIAPTLTVAAGKSVSVFVARDLDFSSVETGP